MRCNPNQFIHSQVMLRKQILIGPLKDSDVPKMVHTIFIEVFMIYLSTLHKPTSVVLSVIVTTMKAKYRFYFATMMF